MLCDTCPTPVACLQHGCSTVVYVSATSKTSALEKQISGNHYKDKTIQPVVYILANNLGFCAGNVVKYITRYKEKNGAEDIRKAIHYCQLLLELEYSEKD